MKYPLMRNNFDRSDLDAVIEHLKNDDPKLTQGPFVEKFEKAWSEWLNVRYSVFVNSGASANLLSLAILRQKYPAGGDVIVPALTWISDIASVIQNGFRPIFVDINRRTLSMDTNQVLEKITPNTRAVFLTHAQGFNGLTDKLITELKARNIYLIEDVCESHGATHREKKLGSFGWISNFSFYYAHHMSTIEGGMICTDDPDAYQIARMLRSHGMLRESNDPDYRNGVTTKEKELNPDFIFMLPGYNCRNTEIGGILGLRQLNRLDDNNLKRTENFYRFLERIDKKKFRTDFEMIGSSNYAFNLIQIDPDIDYSAKLMSKLREKEIEFRRGSAGGGNQLRQPYLRGIVGPHDYQNYPETEHVHFFGYYIGNFPQLNINDVDYITKVINGV